MRAKQKQKKNKKSVKILDNIQVLFRYSFQLAAKLNFV